jgi:hypothetical protein
MGTHALRYLGRPRRIAVSTDGDGAPWEIMIDGRLHRVDSVGEEWLIDDLWWTDDPVERRYVEVILGNGARMEIYRTRSGWWLSGP